MSSDEKHDDMMQPKKNYLKMFFDLAWANKPVQFTVRRRQSKKADLRVLSVHKRSKLPQPVETLEQFAARIPKNTGKVA
jgi:hypothetical protein